MASKTVPKKKLQKRALIYIDMPPIMLKTAHTAVQYILSGKANSGKVSNPRLAAWTLTLLNREIEVQKFQHLAAVPDALMSAEEAHECPLPDMHAPAFKTPFLLEAKYEDAKENSQEIWVVDGSSSHHSTSPLAGFAAMQASSGKIVQGTIRHHSAQAAEIAAVIAALRSADPQKDITVSLSVYRLQLGPEGIHRLDGSLAGEKHVFGRSTANSSCFIFTVCLEAGRRKARKNFSIQGQGSQEKSVRDLHPE